MTVREAAEQAAVLFREGLVSDRETVRTFADILSRLNSKDIPHNELIEV
jgi:hypothetical protein